MEYQTFYLLILYENYVLLFFRSESVKFNVTKTVLESGNRYSRNFKQAKLLLSKDMPITTQNVIKTISTKLTRDNLDLLNIADYDYIIDACDTITVKIESIKQATENNIKLISCMGTGNRFNPTKLEITDISKTYNDPLAKVVRKLLKEENIKHAKVVFSSENPIKTHEKTPGSTSLVPSVAGILLAAYVINDCLNKSI